MFESKACSDLAIMYNSWRQTVHKDHTLDSGIDVGQRINVGPWISTYLHIAEKNAFPLFNKREGPKKQSKINKRGASVYSGVCSKQITYIHR